MKALTTTGCPGICQQNQSRSSALKDADIYSTATTACACAGQVGQMHELLAELESVALKELKREWNGTGEIW